MVIREVLWHLIQSTPGASKSFVTDRRQVTEAPVTPMWGLSQLSRPPGPSDDSDISSPSQLNSCSSSSAGLAWARWRLAVWLSEESCRVSLNTAERPAQDTQESLHRRISSNLPYHTSFHSPFLSIFTASDQMSDVPPAAPMGLLWCHGLEDQLTGATAWCCHGWPQSGPSPLLRIIQPKHKTQNTYIRRTLNGHWM